MEDGEAVGGSGGNGDRAVQTEAHSRLGQGCVYLINMTAASSVREKAMNISHSGS